MHSSNSAKLTSSGIVPGKRLIAYALALAITITSVLSVSQVAQGAPVLTIRPVAWGVVGLDSNNVNAGPNVFQIGAQVCNTGDASATNVLATYNWTTSNSLVNIAAGSST